MNEFEKYYKNHFAKNLLSFINRIPIENNKHYNKNEFNIQYFFLTPKYNYLEIIEKSMRGNFAIALFWTILIDQMMYSEYKNDYQSFQKKHYTQSL